MRKLGMVGGTGPESTLLYYRAMTEGVQRECGAEQLPELVVDSLSVYRVMDFCDREDLDGLTAYISAAVDNLVAAGGEVATLTALTPHIVFDRVRAASPVPMISAVEVTRDEALARGVHTLALLGTEYTMTRGFVAGPLREAGLRVVLPTAEEITLIQSRIFHELEHGIVTEQTLADFRTIIERLRDEEGAEQVILGCTELPLILNDDTSPLPCLDALEVHTEALIREVLAD